jgi:hypothetical protein
MNDLKDLLEKALNDGPAADPSVDPAADLARGRARLRRRRTLAVAGATAVVLGVGFVPLALNNGGSADRIQAGSSSPGNQKPAAPKSSSAQTDALPALSLVAYHGKQVPGYRVASTPEGWAIQGGDPYVLTIAPKDAKDKEYSSFVGKIAVMLMSKDATAPTEGKQQKVDGRTGWLDVQGDTQILTYQAADKRWMIIQAPTSLGWDGDRLAEFAAGVEVLGNAEAGVG